MMLEIGPTKISSIEKSSPSTVDIFVSARSRSLCLLFNSVTVIVSCVGLLVLAKTIKI